MDRFFSLPFKENFGTLQLPLNADKDLSDVVFDKNISLVRHLYEEKYSAINISGFNICALNVILFDF